MSEKILHVPFKAEAEVWAEHQRGVPVHQIAQARGTEERVIRLMLRRQKRKIAARSEESNV